MRAAGHSVHTQDTPYYEAMAAVTIQNVRKQYGTQIVLDDVRLELRAGETAGLVGANGSGKTTLFRLIAGELSPDLGTITRSRGLEIGFLRQEPDISLESTLYDEVGSVFADLLALEGKLHAVSDQMAACADQDRLSELMGDYERINARFIAGGGHGFETRLHEILGGLGFTPADYTTPMSVLSGGQKCRAALAKLLLGNRGFLLLDEPTNHLDIDAIRWLEKFLTGHHGGAVIVSHDRYLLDRLCDRIIEIEHTKVASFPGNYTSHTKAKEIRLLTRQRQLQKDSEFIKKERAFIAKHLATQRTKEAQGRRKRLERRLKAGEFVTEASRKTRTVRFAFEKTEAKATTVVRCDDLCMAYDDNTLFTELTYQVHAGVRFGITGPNGTGKTTLLRIILGEVPPIAGSVMLDPKLTVGYYAQEHADLEPKRSVVDQIRAVHPELSEQDARTLLGRFLFTGDDVFKPLGMLSGGEQSRVRLATLILQSPDVLVLDEPTNHLDIPSREALEEALLDFPGTMIVVSHDRYFLDRVVDRLLVLRRDGHAVYDGNYSFYIQNVEQERDDERVRDVSRRKQVRRTKANEKRTKTGPSPYDRMSIDELEAIVMDHEARLAELHRRFADSTVYRDPTALAELRAKVEALTEELTEVEAAWHERVDSQ